MGKNTKNLGRSLEKKQHIALQVSKWFSTME